MLMILEYVFVAILVVLVVTQIIIPIFAQRPVFPLFRKRTDLEVQIRDLNEQADVDALQTVVDVKKEELETNRDKRYY